jgi:hypothetical protein
MADEDWIPNFNDALGAWNKRFIVTSPDVDGLLSAALMCDHFGAKLIGIYTTSHLILFDNFTTEAAKQALWVDHDISHPGIICMGQHLIRLEVSDKIPTRHKPNFNPNMIWPVAWKNCFNGRQAPKVDKYPFATIHYLMRGLEINDPNPGTLAYSLLAHADGTWVTSYDYPYNCNQWREWMFKDWPGLINDLVDQTYASEESLETHLGLLKNLLDVGISKGRSRSNVSQDIPSKWASIEGHQGVRFSIRTKHVPWVEKFNGVYKFISETMNWEVAYPQKITQVISGQAQPEYPDRILRNSSLDEWMEENEVFSHAITFRNTIRYTTGIRFN